MRPKPLARRLSAKRRANKTRIRSVLSLGSPGLRSPWRMELLSRNSVKILVSPPWAIRAPRRLHRLSLVSHVRIARRTWVLAVLPRGRQPKVFRASGLATNAAKYGALSAICWTIAGDGKLKRLKLKWKETGHLSGSEDTCS
jgi:hypothetical protein